MFSYIKSEMNIQTDQLLNISRPNIKTYSNLGPITVMQDQFQSKTREKNNIPKMNTNHISENDTLA